MSSERFCPYCDLKLDYRFAIKCFDKTKVKCPNCKQLFSVTYKSKTNKLLCKSAFFVNVALTLAAIPSVSIISWYFPVGLILMFPVMFLINKSITFQLLR